MLKKQIVQTQWVNTTAPVKINLNPGVVNVNSYEFKQHTKLNALHMLGGEVPRPAMLVANSLLRSVVYRIMHYVSCKWCSLEQT